jgi:hypothetical protein
MDQTVWLIVLMVGILFLFGFTLGLMAGVRLMRRY